MNSFFLNKSRALFAVFVFFLFLGAIVFAQFGTAPGIGSVPGFNPILGRTYSDLCENCWFKVPMQCRLEEAINPQPPLPTNAPFGFVSGKVTVDQGPFETLPPDYYFLHPYWLGQENVLLPPDELDDRRFVAQLYDKSLNVIGERQFDLPELSFVAFGDGINEPDPFCTEFGIVPYVYLPHDRRGQYIHIKSLDDHGLYDPSTQNVPHVNIEDFFNEIEHNNHENLPHDSHQTTCIGDMKKISTPGGNFYLTNNLDEAVNNCQAGWHAAGYNRKYELMYVTDELWEAPPQEGECLCDAYPNPLTGDACYYVCNNNVEPAPLPGTECAYVSSIQDPVACAACHDGLSGIGHFQADGYPVPECYYSSHQSDTYFDSFYHTPASDIYYSICGEEGIPGVLGCINSNQEPPPEYPPRTIFYYRILPENNCAPTELPSFTDTWVNNLDISGSPAPDIYAGDNTAVCIAVAGEYCRCKIAPFE